MLKPVDCLTQTFRISQKELSLILLGRSWNEFLIGFRYLTRFTVRNASSSDVNSGGTGSSVTH